MHSEKHLDTKRKEGRSWHVGFQCWLDCRSRRSRILKVRDFELKAPENLWLIENKVHLGRVCLNFTEAICHSQDASWRSKYSCNQHVWLFGLHWLSLSFLRLEKLSASYRNFCGTKCVQIHPQDFHRGAWTTSLWIWVKRLSSIVKWKSIFIIF